MNPDIEFKYQKYKQSYKWGNNFDIELYENRIDGKMKFTHIASFWELDERFKCSKEEIISCIENGSIYISHYIDEVEYRGTVKFVNREPDKDEVQRLNKKERESNKNLKIFFIIGALLIIGFLISK